MTRHGASITEMHPFAYCPSNRAGVVFSLETYPKPRCQMWELGAGVLFALGPTSDV